MASSFVSHSILSYYIIKMSCYTIDHQFIKACEKKDGANQQMEHTWNYKIINYWFSPFYCVVFSRFIPAFSGAEMHLVKITQPPSHEKMSTTNCNFKGYKPGKMYSFHAYNIYRAPMFKYYLNRVDTHYTTAIIMNNNYLRA